MSKIKYYQNIEDELLWNVEIKGLKRKKLEIIEARLIARRSSLWSERAFNRDMDGGKGNDEINEEIEKIEKKLPEVENALATNTEPPGPEEDPSFIPFELRDSTPKIKFFMFLGAIILFNYFMFFNETTKPIIEAIINGVSRGLTSPVLRDPDRPDWN
jgi:hypothetical protein